MKRQWQFQNYYYRQWTLPKKCPWRKIKRRTLLTKAECRWQIPHTLSYHYYTPTFAFSLVTVMWPSSLRMVIRHLHPAWSFQGPPPSLPSRDPDMTWLIKNGAWPCLVLSTDSRTQDFTFDLVTLTWLGSLRMVPGPACLFEVDSQPTHRPCLKSKLSFHIPVSFCWKSTVSTTTKSCQSICA